LRTKLLLASVALLAGGAGLAVWWLAAGRASDAAPGPPVAEVYAGVAAALSRPGMVAHVIFDDGASDALISGKREAWLDLSNDVARERTTTMYRSPSVSTTRELGVVYARGEALGVGEDGKSYAFPIEGCPDLAKRTLTLFGNCPAARGKIETHTESGRRFDRIDALAIVTTGELYGIDSTIAVHDVLFVDAITHLPFAYENKGTDRYALGGYEQKFDRTTRYRIDFVSRDALPANFFEPASIGYVPTPTATPPASQTPSRSDLPATPDRR
jgi:hypothetical protein